jgi:hypothetical protein
VTDTTATQRGCCTGSSGVEPAPPAVVPLPIVWQRLINDTGETCGRCGSTHAEVEQAVAVLTEALRPLGLEPRLETRIVERATFTADPTESNRIWVAGRPLEDWVGADVGTSRCSTVCGDSNCRTVVIGGDALEVVPSALIVKAGLLAAGTLTTA